MRPEEIVLGSKEDIYLILSHSNVYAALITAQKIYKYISNIDYIFR
jgi:hypothetical protein